MGKHGIPRRSFLQGAAVAALGMPELLRATPSPRPDGAPNSSGTGVAKVKAPPGSCDCHHHIYDTRFPFSTAGARMVPNTHVADYRLLQQRIGTTRDIVVTPAPYPATFADNRVTLDALSQFGPNARGVAVVSPAITDAELKTLADAGVRGIRFSLAEAKSVEPVINEIEPLSRRVSALGWHVQINMTADQIAAAKDLWDRLASPIVFDHMGHMPEPDGTKHPAFGVIRTLVDKNKAWVKLSVTYDSSKIGPPTYADVNKVGQAYVQAAPERMVWGSNWPHPAEENKPDDAVLFDLLAQWAPREATRHRILVENPEKLYGFAKTT
jgi:predicted TIM-barrel fold metal-dependent hydrolase